MRRIPCPVFRQPTRGTTGFDKRRVVARITGPGGIASGEVNANHLLRKQFSRRIFRPFTDNGGFQTGGESL